MPLGAIICVTFQYARWREYLCLWQIGNVGSGGLAPHQLA